MRIGIDMLAVQSPHHGHRGIGRYGVNLVSTMLGREDGHEYVLYAHTDLPDTRLPTHPRAEMRWIRPRWALGETITPFMDRLARVNPDGLDILLILSPFEKWALYGPPAKPKNGLRMASVIHDLIPFLFQNEMEVDPVLVRHYRVLEELTRYDVLLANSEATRQDFLSVMRIPDDQVVTIGAASNPEYFRPDKVRPASRETKNKLQALGINRPYLFNVGGLDPRKNTWTLIDAFAVLPERIRRRYQLVLTFEISYWDRGHVLDQVKRLNLEDSVVVTGEVSDDTLRMLYQQADVFLFPSSYEGFGLPILEALHCGVPVIAGNNSSQVEVVGDGGLLVDVNDLNDIAGKITRVIEEPGLSETLQERAIAHASNFSWERSADIALEAMAHQGSRRPTRRLRFDRGHSRKPTIAFFSPLPPRKSGISDYSAFLLDELRQTYRIDLFHDSGYVPEPALASPEFMACDYGLFERMAGAKDYHAIVYQMGNSRYHNFMYEIMIRYPGVMTLHDFCLAGFHLHYGHTRRRGFRFIRDELDHWYPESRGIVEPMAETWTNDWDAISRECVARGWHLNRHVIDASSLTVFHSPWCVKQIEQLSPQYADKVMMIPHGIHPKQTTEARRVEIREQFNIPGDALVFGSFGFVHPDKMQTQALDAFKPIADRDSTALYLFVGEDADCGVVRRRAEALGLEDRVRFMGRQPAGVFSDLMLVTDIGVNLRMPPTNGETSGALLNLLAAGVPTIVTDVATFSDYPASVVRKVEWETDGQAGLDRAMAELADHPEVRNRLGRASWDYVDDHHEWSRIAKLYVEAIERSHEQVGGVLSKPTMARPKAASSI